MVGSAQTGSGKTLSFLIPAVEHLVRVQFKPRNGTGVVCIAPTRELALQIYGVVKELCKFHLFTHGMCVRLSAVCLSLCLGLAVALAYVWV